MKSVELVVTILILLTIFTGLWKTYSQFADDAHQALQKFNQTSEVRYAASLIISLRTYGIPFEFEGVMSPQSDLVKLSVGGGVDFNPFTGKYEYLACRRW